MLVQLVWCNMGLAWMVWGRCQLMPQQKVVDGERRITVSGHILDTDCKHVPCAEIEVRVSRNGMHARPGNGDSLFLSLSLSLSLSL